MGAMASVECCITDEDRMRDYNLMIKKEQEKARDLEKHCDRIKKDNTKVQEKISKLQQDTKDLSNLKLQQKEEIRTKKVELDRLQKTKNGLESELKALRRDLKK
mmetsp:Transcript_14631/g.22033  ORF Transcript_14631/g.22033 Transcript_14631/m.22033 type:complete len:104 (-) Transcript_14631:154-465(-)|eukprot:CAMPEP_0202714066 /NCGR_PEP_ID=MMETSP1385-20130828/62310_1 /ASSEMBLY_ACC=CAM_ASM_000861 /TAXON_ID=933848 /ORGANISM="Elphidium margaritaceum" /LENGTH=103 /DNA_ID=CAMNT_0049374633 /DNA_START=33 /DNA_END=344 /DNA_ORIENTATION=-